MAIGTHSPKTLEYSNDNNINFRDINPFRGPWGVSTPKLGPFYYKDSGNIAPRKNHKKQRSRLMPFLTILDEDYGPYKEDVSFLATDDGVYETMEALAFAFRGDNQHILAFDKERSEVGKIKIKGIKHYSTATFSDIRGKIGVTFDDRILTGNTLVDTSSLLKEEYGIRELVGGVACDMAESPDTLKESPFDKFFILETHPNSHIKNNPNIIRLPMETTALLFASEIYDSYVSLRKTGKLPKVR